MRPSYPPVPRLKSPSGDPEPGLSTMLGIAPHVRDGVMNLSAALRHGLNLEPRVRELVVLHMAVTHGTEYEWGHHVPIAREAGLSDDEIRNIRDAPQKLTADQQLVMRYVAAVDQESVDDELWAEMAATYSPAELIELTLIIGHYSMITKAVWALRPKLQANFSGFEYP